MWGTLATRVKLREELGGSLGQESRAEVDLDLRHADLDGCHLVLGRRAVVAATLVAPAHARRPRRHRRRPRGGRAWPAQQLATREPADPFATPLEILPEWYFFPTFNALRVIPNKLLGVLSMAAVPVGLITVPFLESINKFQNPFRRPVATSVFLIGTFYAIWMGIGATMPIDKAITLGVF